MLDHFGAARAGNHAIDAQQIYFRVFAFDDIKCTVSIEYGSEFPDCAVAKGNCANSSTNSNPVSLNLVVAMCTSNFFQIGGVNAMAMKWFTMAG